jgi:hypothetical protein
MRRRRPVLVWDLFVCCRVERRARMSLGGGRQVVRITACVQERQERLELKIFLFLESNHHHDPIDVC